MNNKRYYHDLNNAIHLLDTGHFHDMACTFTWLWSPCRELGNAIPLHMIENGNTEALLEFIHKMIDENPLRTP